jgi:hypothetical protein
MVFYLYVKLIIILNLIERVMSTITFDTLKYVEKLKAAGVPEAQAKAEAEALVTAFSEAMDSQLATKSDINRLERELIVVKWMVGLVLGGILTLILKAFFPV